VIIGDCAGISVTAVSFADATVSLFSDFHFALSTFSATEQATRMSLFGEKLFVYQEEQNIICEYGLPFIAQRSSLINAASKALASYWRNHQKIAGCIIKLNEMWKRIWEEANPLTSQGILLAKAFLTGQNPPDISTEIHRGRMRKSIAHELVEIKRIVAYDVIPAFLELDTALNHLQAAMDINSELGLVLPSSRSQSQVKDCLSMIANFTKLEECFSALFDYLQDRVIGSLSISEFTEFLVKYLGGFDLPDIRIRSGTEPKSSPIFSVEIGSEMPVPGIFSDMRLGKCVALSDKGINVLSMIHGHSERLAVGGCPLAAYPFEEGMVGCFFRNENRPYFVMFGDGSEEVTAYEVPLLDAAVFTFSPRKIALLESRELFCAVVDLQPE
jgi:hypothetical protein